MTTNPAKHYLRLLASIEACKTMKVCEDVAGVKIVSAKPSGEGVDMVVEVEPGQQFMAMAGFIDRHHVRILSLGDGDGFTGNVKAAPPLPPKPAPEKPYSDSYGDQESILQEAHKNPEGIDVTAFTNVKNAWKAIHKTVEEGTCNCWYCVSIKTVLNFVQPFVNHMDHRVAVPMTGKPEVDQAIMRVSLIHNEIAARGCCPNIACRCERLIESETVTKGITKGLLICKCCGFAMKQGTP